MAESWKEFEQLVARLESIFLNSDIKVTPNDHIPDKVTGEMRQIDISLRGSVGSVPILVIIECKELSRSVDVTYVERLAKVREKVGANKAVAVSSKGFTKAAVTTAKDEGIDLRTLAEIDHRLIYDWFQVSSITNRTRKVDIIGIEKIEFIDPDALTRVERNRLNKFLRQFPVGKRLFTVGVYPRLFSLFELVQMLETFEAFFDDMREGEPKIVEKVEMIPENPDSQILLWYYHSDTIRVRRIILSLRLKFETQEIPFNSVKEYRGAEDGLCQVLQTAEHTFWEPNQRMEIVLPKNNEKQTIHFRVFKDSPDIEKDPQEKN